MTNSMAVLATTISKGVLVPTTCLEETTAIISMVAPASTFSKGMMATII